MAEGAGVDFTLDQTQRGLTPIRSERRRPR